MEGAMKSFWQSLTVASAEVSFAWRVLVVVCLASILALVFEASMDAIFPIFTLGFLAAVAEHVMRDRNSP
jgi:hypothetical protein